MLLMLQVHVTVLVLNLFKPWNLSSGNPITYFWYSFPPLSLCLSLLHNEALHFRKMLDSFQMSFTAGPHNDQKASLDIIFLLQVWSLLCIAQLSENSLVVRNIFVKNLDDRIKLFVILGPDRWWCCWQSIISGYTHTLPSFPIMNRFQYVPS